MHFVTGGAFNGKAKWVHKCYNLDQRRHWMWQNNYKQVSLDFAEMVSNNQEILIINGIEILIKEYLQKYGEIKAREAYQEFLHEATQWEKQNEDHKLILIGTDITKGIVPMNKADRLWRDYVGWCYQDTVEKAERVDIVWYGISNNVKFKM